MIGKVVKGIFGSKNDRELKRIAPLVEAINRLEPEFQALSDAQLQAKTGEFKERLSKGESLDELLPEAFAAVREASVRVLGMRPFDVQLIGGVVLHEGKIAEMKTGEGKTLAATMPLYLNALTGRGVHLVTVNDYLARRDAEWMGGIYRFLGLSVGVIVHGMDDQERKKAYACDITYGTNNEFGFDYLRDNMKFDLNDFVQRDFYYAIVDEVDSILIDEARTPLIISGPVERSQNKVFLEVKPLVINLKRKQGAVIRSILQEARKLLASGQNGDRSVELLLKVKRGDPKNPVFLDVLAHNQALKKEIDRTENVLSAQKLLPEIDKDLYCTIDERSNAVELTEKGIRLLSSGGLGDFMLPDLDEESYRIREDENLSPEEKTQLLSELEERYMRSSELLHATQQLIKAYWLFEKDVHYVIKDGQVVIVDEFTGRMMPGRRWSDGLHQAVEAKEGVSVAEENQTLATITFQNFFRMYEKLAGMTGTADTEAAEFNDTYKLDVVVVPTNKKMIRIDYPDVIYKSEREKFKAVVEEIKELYDKGQPVLVGTISIEKSEMLSKMLKRAGIPHSVLNAKHHEKEAEIVAKAGQAKTVTISTNMAGRGTDIVLGDGVVELGGLHILGTERHESRRIDNQLRGRSGRQGDPGSSRFYLSLEDDLLRIFGSDRIASIMGRLGMEEGQPIEHNLISKAIENAQKKVEAHNFDIRKHLLEYDDVMNTHREIIYSLRKDILAGDNVKQITENMADEKIESLVERFIDPKAYPDDWDIDGLKENVARIFGFAPKIGPKDLGEDAFESLKAEDLVELIKKEVREAHEKREMAFGSEDFTSLEKYILLQIIDSQWVIHLQDMESMKEGIGLRGYGQLDPLQEYKKEGYALFEELMDRIREETLMTLSRVQLLRQRPSEELPKKKKRAMQFSHGDSGDRPETVRRKGKKIGRNDPCPCGSGKKYKKCCGAKK
ncbi:MAG: preprotein translocase subunit SecA [Deltaproteobacteria bacterium]|nr:preprotein translocase subunit SecA [Deltaproteobacteria bacterium]MBW1935616.1 preprotein translocase subunit SecA [Deltaproteobacteria bacterium]MBW1978407.1 preprotein translocase subunit SecA [Deltaproteobacteria bacterium]MBW2045633.1 preprotein translocase subunit SecA [Deltaproteobacteria bacterium]MBW2300902.1 preprotein translocase subunit SecA [Deltaproteobacteria bacterium]